MGNSNFERIVLTFVLVTLMTVFSHHEFKKEKNRTRSNHPKRKDERVLFYNIIKEKFLFF